MPVHCRKHQRKNCCESDAVDAIITHITGGAASDAESSTASAALREPKGTELEYLFTTSKCDTGPIN